MNIRLAVRTVLILGGASLLLFLGGAGCGDNSTSTHASEHSTNVVVITEANFQSEVMTSTKPVLVDFWAPWCGPCRKIGPVVSELADDFVGRAKVAKVNVDEAPSLAQKFGVQAIPTLLIFQGGRVVDQVMGALPKSELAAKLEKVLPETKR